MTGLSLLIPCLAAALSIASLVMLVLRAATRTGGAVPLQLPFFLSVCRWPARLLSPTVASLMPVATEARLRSVLDAQGLSPGVTPAMWIAIRSVHAVLGAAAVIGLGGAQYGFLAMVTGAAGFLLGGLWLQKSARERERQITRELPGYLDLLTVCVEAGATLTAGVRLVVAQAPQSPLRSYFERVLREVRSGRTRAEAFSHVAVLYRVESLTTLANALSHAEAAGMSLGQILRTQSGQRTAERFAHAEKLAMQAPVKMLGPLIFCIFPCTFIVLAVPISVRLLQVLQS